MVRHFFVGTLERKRKVVNLEEYDETWCRESDWGMTDRMGRRRNVQVWMGEGNEGGREGGRVEHVWCSGVE